jgi:hypothetical protein
MRASVALLALVATGCFAKPGFSGSADDANGDDDGGSTGHAPKLRLINTAYASSYDHPPVSRSTPGMTGTTWEIETNGIVDGDLVLFIANVDNGSNGVWQGLDTQEFTQLVQLFYPGDDGQTFIVAWRIAGPSEPATYTGGFGQDIHSAATTIALLAVTGYDRGRERPIEDSMYAVEPGATGTRPSPSTSPGVTTTVPDTLLVWGTGSDWYSPSGGANTFTAPTGFTSLVTLGDRGNMMFDWTSEQIAYRVQATPGATGPIQGTLSGTVPGLPWNVVLAIPPPPL